MIAREEYYDGRSMLWPGVCKPCRRRSRRHAKNSCTQSPSTPAPAFKSRTIWRPWTPTRRARPIRKSSTASKMPGIGDELHHMGWNACSSCHDDSGMSRKYLLVPGVRSNNIHVIDTRTDPRSAPSKVIDGAEIKPKTNLSGPHTVHCLGSEIIISLLGDARAKRPVVICTSTKNSRSLALGKLNGRYPVRL